MANGQSVSDALRMTSADGSTGKPIVDAIFRPNDEPDATDDIGVAFTTGNVLANISDPTASDCMSMPVLGPGAPLGLLSDNGDGVYTRAPKSCFHHLFGRATAPSVASLGNVKK